MKWIHQNVLAMEASLKWGWKLHQLPELCNCTSRAPRKKRKRQQEQRQVCSRSHRNRRRVLRHHPPRPLRPHRPRPPWRWSQNPFVSIGKRWKDAWKSLERQARYYRELYRRLSRMDLKSRRHMKMMQRVSGRWKMRRSDH